MPGVKKTTNSTKKKVKPDPIIIPDSGNDVEDNQKDKNQTKVAFENGSECGNGNENEKIPSVGSPPPAPKKRASRKKVVIEKQETETKQDTDVEATKIISDVGMYVTNQEKNTNNPVEFDVDSMSRSSHIYLYDFPKTVELMEKVKSKVEMLCKEEHLSLMKSIFTMFHDRLSRRDGVDPFDARRRAFEELKSQVTQNQNGIFLNLTTCSDDLWQSCYSCIHILERQHTDFERLDKERQAEIEQMVQNL